MITAAIARRTIAVLIAALLLAAVIGGSGAVPIRAAASPSTPLLVGVRATPTPGFDRVVFVFSGAVPAHRTARYVERLIADPRGQAIQVPGRAILAVSFRTAAAHTEAGRLTAPVRATFALPNVITAVRSGDFEGVLSYGIGVARRAHFRLRVLGNPGRIVLEVATAFRTVPMRVYLFNDRRFAANTPPFVTGVSRQIAAASPATGLMDRLFAGPTARERARGLRFLASRATGFAGLSVSAGVARIRLTGGCGSGGSTATIGEEITTTLKQLPAVRWVKIYDPAGHTEQPLGLSDSIPTCLEP